MSEGARPETGWALTVGASMSGVVTQGVPGEPRPVITGRDDLLQIVRKGDGEDAVSSVTALQPTDSQVLWSRSVHGKSLWVRGGGDEDGSPGVELLEQRTGSGGASLRSVSGRTGLDRWHLAK